MSRDDPKSDSAPQAVFRRPAVYFIIPFAAGLAAALTLHPPILTTAIIAVISFVAAVIAYTANNRFSRWVIYGAVFAAGFFLYAAFSQTAPKNDVLFSLVGRQPGESPDNKVRYNSVKTVLTGTVGNDPERRLYGSVFVMNVESFVCDGEEKPAAGKCRVTVYDEVEGEPPDIEYGDVIEVSGILSRPTPPRYPGGFDYRNYLKNRGINTILTTDAENVTVIGQKRLNPVYRFSFIAKKRFAEAIEKNVPADRAKLTEGLLIGSKGEIDRETLDDFTDAGVIHILAVSGQNVSFLAFVLFLILSGTRMPRRWVAAIVMVFVPLYVIISGMDPPVIRAGVMAEITLLALYLKREVDLYNVLTGSAILILLFNPLLIGDVSFQLSYAACFGIALGYRPTDAFLGRFKTPGILRETLAATVAAQAGVLPLGLWYFHRVSAVSFIANLFIIPLSALNAIFGLLTAITYPFVPIIARFYGATTALIADAIFAITGIFASGFYPLIRIIPGIPPEVAQISKLQFWVGRPEITVLIIIWAAVIFLFAANSKVKKGSLLIALIFALTVVWGKAVYAPDPGLELVFLHVGNADSCVIITPQRKVIVVDTGDVYDDYSAGRAVVAPFLHSRGIDGIDVLCVTHTDSDHIGGAQYLVETMPVGEIWVRPEPGNVLNDELTAAVLSRGVPVIDPAPSVSIIDGVVISRLWPPEGKDISGYSTNDRSTVLSLRYGDFGAVLTGDAGLRPQLCIMETGIPLNSTLLKAPHHGKSKDISPSFYYSVSPEITVIPAKNRLGSRGAATEYPFFRGKTYNTGDYGAIIVYSDGESVKLRSSY